MNSTTQKAVKAEIGMGRAMTELPGWWAVAPVGERRFLGSLARMMRSAKRSKSPDVAQAATKWERTLGCFIKVRLMGERRKAECRMRRAALTSFPSAAHSRRGAAPDRG